MEDLIQKDLNKQESKKLYYEHYKNIESISNQNQFYKIDNSIHTKLIKNQLENNVFPLPLNIIKCKGSNLSIKANNF